MSRRSRPICDRCGSLSPDGICIDTQRLYLRTGIRCLSAKSLFRSLRRARRSGRRRRCHVRSGETLECPGSADGRRNVRSVSREISPTRTGFVASISRPSGRLELAQDADVFSLCKEFADQSHGRLVHRGGRRPKGSGSTPRRSPSRRASRNLAPLSHARSWELPHRKLQRPASRVPRLSRA